MLRFMPPAHSWQQHENTLYHDVFASHGCVSVERAAYRIMVLLNVRAIQLGMQILSLMNGDTQ